jgi:hypothetical protein
MFRLYELRVETGRLTVFNVREDDLSGLQFSLLRATSQGTVTRSFSSSDQFMCTRLHAIENEIQTAVANASASASSSR